MATQLYSVLGSKYPFGTGVDSSLNISGTTAFSTTDISCSGNSGSTTLTLGTSGFTNGDVVFIHQTRGTGVGQCEVNKISSGGGTSSLTLTTALSYTYTDSGASQAQVLKIPMHTNITISSGGVWYSPSWDGNVGGIVVFGCAGTLTIEGSSLSSAYGFVGINGPAPSGNIDGKQGEGTAGPSGTTSRLANGNGGGGGEISGDKRTGGGGGGHANAGEDGQYKGGTPLPGVGGIAVGTPTLTNINLGGSGGTGGTDASQAGGKGGDGGGIIIGFVKNLVVTGSIVSNGEDGEDRNAGGGGGGGAGGAILFNCYIATLGTNLVTALGGAGGTTINGDSGYGGDGSLGRIAINYGHSYTGSTNPGATFTQDTHLRVPSAAPIIMG